jgi:tRNA nucleotidyltransferase (CCA-adding enzyme)
MLPPPLENAVIPEAAVDVVRGLQGAGFKAFLVGGSVRDLLLGQTGKDWDVATSARPEEVQRLFKKVIPTGIQHGTVTVLSRGAHIEVTTFRSEGEYVDGRRPSAVTFETDIEADLSRRDFTVNALAFDPIGRVLLDPFGGQADLAARRIRCVGDARERFSEDGLRPMRAVRFAAVLGFEIDPETLAAIPPALPSFRKVSMERTREELSKLLLSPRAALGLGLLQQTGMLAVFLPEATADFGRVQGVAPDIALRLAATLYPVTGDRAREIALRLKYPTRVADAVALLVAGASQIDPVPKWTDAQVRQFLARGVLRSWGQVLQLAEADGREVAALRAHIDRVLSENPPLEPKQLALKGLEIMEALGVGPSPIVGEASRYLFESVLETPAFNTPEGLRKLLKEWQKSLS